MPPDPKNRHTPVLLDETLDCLNPQPGRLYVDATLGAGGHSRALLERLGPEGRLIGIDQDKTALALARERLAGLPGTFETQHANFSELKTVLQGRMVDGGILADLGVSSMQLDEAERGFSFSKPARLDMRMDTRHPLDAAELVNTAPEAELVRIFSEYGEEHMSKTVARTIVERRKQQPFETTTDLADLVASLYKQKGKHAGKIHPATRVFQALRMAVNDELGHLERFLAQLPRVTAPGARIAVISFHSLEDRLVKQFFQRESRDCICPPRLPVCQCGHKAAFRILSKPIKASEAELKSNPRARSAKLRCAERI